MQTRLDHFQRLWSGVALQGCVLAFCKHEVRRKLDELVNHSARQRAGRKIMVFLRRAVF